MSSALRPPEFFFDRSLGKETARLLRDRGWNVHLLAEVYAADAQSVLDEEWIAYGSAQGWALLSKDKKIRYRGTELSALHNGMLFCLANGNLLVAEMADRFESARPRIEHAAADAEAGFWKVYANGEIRRTWP